MILPTEMPVALRSSDQPFYAFASATDGVVAPGIFDWIPIPGIGDGLKCAACCAGKAGFAACVARCLVTHQACDGGVDNCSPC
jgi:hypothetical protein